MYMYVCIYHRHPIYVCMHVYITDIQANPVKPSLAYHAAISLGAYSATYYYFTTLLFSHYSTLLHYYRHPSQPSETLTGVSGSLFSAPTSQRAHHHVAISG